MNIPGPPPVLHKGNHPSVRMLQCQRGLSRPDSCDAVTDSGRLWTNTDGKGLVE